MYALVVNLHTCFDGLHDIIYLHCQKNECPSPMYITSLDACCPSLLHPCIWTNISGHLNPQMDSHMSMWPCVLAIWRYAPTPPPLPNEALSCRHFLPLYSPFVHPWSPTLPLFVLFLSFSHMCFIIFVKWPFWMEMFHLNGSEAWGIVGKQLGEGLATITCPLYFDVTKIMINTPCVHPRATGSDIQCTPYDTWRLSHQCQHCWVRAIPWLLSVVVCCRIIVSLIREVHVIVLR